MEERENPSSGVFLSRDFPVFKARLNSEEGLAWPREMSTNERGRALEGENCGCLCVMPGDKCDSSLLPG